MHQFDDAMPNVIPLPRPLYFGVCPECGGQDGYINIGSDHWFICRRHSLKWYAGKANFPGWLSENERIWKLNHILLSHYREVVPRHPRTGRRSAAGPHNHAPAAIIAFIPARAAQQVTHS